MSGPFGEGPLPEVLLLACRPVDITGMPIPAELTREEIINIVTTEHIRIECDHCGRPCWIGPRQQAAYDEYPERASRACYFCMAALMNDEDIYVISLGGGNAPPRGV